MTRLIRRRRRPRGRAPLAPTRPRSVACSGRPRARGADPERGDLARRCVWAIAGAGRLPTRRSAVACGSIAIPALVAILFFAPWAIRDWLAFGSPLPGQALTNALSLDGPRHLRLAGSADALALPRGRPGDGCSGCGSTASATTCSTSCCSPARRCRSSGSSACRGVARLRSLQPLAPGLGRDLPRHRASSSRSRRPGARSSTPPARSTSS